MQVVLPSHPAWQGLLLQEALSILHTIAEPSPQPYLLPAEPVGFGILKTLDFTILYKAVQSCCNLHSLKLLDPVAASISQGLFCFEVYYHVKGSTGISAIWLNHVG